MSQSSAPDPGFRGFVLCACTTVAAAALVYQVTRRLLRRSDAAPFHEVVFFPERPVPAAASGCERNAPPPSDGRRLDCVLRRLAAARRTLDVCVFVLTCPDLSGALLAASRRGVRVRVVLDQEMSTCTGSQLAALRRCGVPVFVKPPPFLMHHKFAVIDGEVLVCGSFNWTRQAALGNNEDVIITNNPALVRPYIGEFKKLWAMRH